MCASRVSSSVSVSVSLSGQDYASSDPDYARQPHGGRGQGVASTPVLSVPNRVAYVYVPQQFFFPTRFNNQPAWQFSGVGSEVPAVGVYAFTPSHPAASPGMQAQPAGDQVFDHGEKHTAVDVVNEPDTDDDSSAASESDSKESPPTIKHRHIVPGEVDKLIRRKSLARVEWENFERWSSPVGRAFKRSITCKDHLLVWMLAYPGHIERLCLHDRYDPKPLDATTVCLLTRVIEAGGLRELSFCLEPGGDLGDPLIDALFEAIKASKLERLTLHLLTFNGEAGPLLARLEGMPMALSLMPRTSLPGKSELQSFMLQAKAASASIKLHLRADDKGEADKLACLLDGDLPVTRVQIDEPLTGALVDAIKRTPSIEELDLRRGKSGAGVQALTELLRANTRLRKIRVQDVPLASAPTLLDAAKGNSSIESLCIDFSGGQALDLTQPLTELVFANRFLQKLIMSPVKLEPEDAVAKEKLLQAFAANNVLRKLELKLESKDKGLWGELLRAAGTLEHIGCYGEERMAAAVADALPTHTTLKSLKLHSRSWSQEEVQTFSQALQKNSSLTHLHMHDDDAEPAKVLLVLTALAANTTFRRLDGLGPEARRLIERRARKDGAPGQSPATRRAPTTTAASSANLPSTT